MSTILKLNNVELGIVNGGKDSAGSYLLSKSVGIVFGLAGMESTKNIPETARAAIIGASVFAGRELGAGIPVVASNLWQNVMDIPSLLNPMA